MKEALRGRRNKSLEMSKVMDDGHEDNEKLGLAPDMHMKSEMGHGSHSQVMERGHHVGMNEEDESNMELAQHIAGQSKDGEGNTEALSHGKKEKHTDLGHEAGEVSHGMHMHEHDSMHPKAMGKVAHDEDEIHGQHSEIKSSHGLSDKSSKVEHDDDTAEEMRNAKGLHAKAQVMAKKYLSSKQKY